MKIAVVGAGWSGLTAAYLLQQKGHRVTVIEKREHIGGNAYDELDANGLIVPKYGAHIFHTYNKEVWQFVNQFSTFNNYVHHVKVKWNGTYYDYPITEQPTDTEKWKERADENFEMACLAKMGERLYEIYVAPYTRKMWGREPHSLSAKLAARVPMRPNGETQMFLDPYQGFPTEGYHTLFENMAYELKSMILYGDYSQYEMDAFDHVIVTSAIDEWYGCDLGKLEYRGMRFSCFPLKTSGCVQVTGTINTNDEPFVLRVEEPKQYYQKESEYTNLVFNYADGDTQYYPVPDTRNDELADKYRKRAASETGVTFIGRLGQYRYLNQDQAVLLAMQAVGGF